MESIKKSIIIPLNRVDMVPKEKDIPMYFLWIFRKKKK